VIDTSRFKTTKPSSAMLGAGRGIGLDDAAGAASPQAQTEHEMTDPTTWSTACTMRHDLGFCGMT